MVSMYNSPEYKRSRVAYTLECTFEYFVALLVSDAFLAKLLTAIGVSASLTGIISTLISLASLFQLGTIFLVRKTKNTKRTVIIFHTAGQICFMFLYLIPFMSFVPAEYKSALAIICILCSYFGNYIVTTLLFKWGNSFVEPTKRARFSANKEMISLLSGVVVSLALGRIMDAFEEADNLEGSFIFAAIGILVFAACDFICLCLIVKEQKPEIEAAEILLPKKSFKDIWDHTVGNRSFVSVLIYSLLYTFATYITSGFLGTFKNEDLNITMTVVQIISIVACLTRAAISRPFGKFSDKHSYINGMILGCSIAAAGYLCVVFTTNATWWLIIVFQILLSVSAAGTGQNLLNVIYSYVDSDYFAEATAIRASLSGIVGFSSSILGGKILAAVQANGNTVFGIPMYGQQLLAAISVVSFVIVILFAKFVVAKQKVKVQ